MNTVAGTRYQGCCYIYAHAQYLCTCASCIVADMYIPIWIWTLFSIKVTHTSICRIAAVWCTCKLQCISESHHIDWIYKLSWIWLVGFPPSNTRVQIYYTWSNTRVQVFVLRMALALKYWKKSRMWQCHSVFCLNHETMSVFIISSWGLIFQGHYVESHTLIGGSFSQNRVISSSN